jgi:predicted transposase YdaD
MGTTRLNYDVVVKDLFQNERPSLLMHLAHGVRIREFLNVELAVVEERVADLVVLLTDETILHLDFQSENHRDMPYREGIYGLMIGQKYRRRIRQVVLYMGSKPLRMADRLDLGGIQVSYELIDIREVDVESLLKSGNPGDCALALLARGGTHRIPEIIEKVNRLPGPSRQRTLTQMAILAGLRGASEQLTMEFRAMGINVDIEQNVFLRDIWDRARAEGLAEGKAAGRAEGRAEGKAEGMAIIVRELLEAKFGPLPQWAQDKLARATAIQAERWVRKLLKADTLEGVLGRK